MENGALAVIDNSRQAVYGYDQRAEVFGSKGMVAIKNDSDSTAVISNEDGVTGENHSSSSLKDTWMHMEKKWFSSLMQLKMTQKHH